MDQNHLNQLSLSDLKKRAQRLQKICDQIDPYGKIGIRDFKKLAEFDITREVCDDPFKLTNQLIKKMEDTLNEILKREKPTLGHLQ